MDNVQIKISNDVTLTQSKIIIYLIQFAKKKLHSKSDDVRFQIELTDFENYINIPYKVLHSELFGLIRIIIEYYSLDNDLTDVKNCFYKTISLMNMIEIDKGVLSYELSPSVLKLLNSQVLYEVLDTIYLKNFNSKFSLALYKTVKNKKQSYITFNISECKTLLCGDDSLYPDFTDFKRRVLDVACNEISNKTDIDCSYTLNKNKNSYQSITFFIENKIQFGDYELSSDLKCYLFNEIKSLFFKDDISFKSIFENVTLKQSDTNLLVISPDDDIKEYLKDNNFVKKITSIIKNTNYIILFDKDFTDVIIK